LAYFRSSLEAYENALGRAHPETARADANIGTVLGAQGKLEQAEPYLRRALERFEQAFGPQHPTVGAAVGNLATNLARRERYDEAIVLLQRALEIKRSGLPEDHPSIVRSLFNLGVAQYEAGRHDEALASLNGGYAVRLRTLPADDPELTPWWRIFGLIALAQSDFSTSRGWFEQVVAAGVHAGESDIELADDRFAFAQALWPDDPARARKLAREVLAVRERDGADARALAELREFLAR
jgi:tetratricopeptide (TPR) repeat protein